MLRSLLLLSLLVAGSSALRSFVDPVVFASSYFDIPSQPQYKWNVSWYPNMPIDHFAYTDSRTFKLRYLINLDNYKPGGPIFFYTGNEGPIDGFANNTGLVWDLSLKFKAAVVFAEHRFYGETLPFGNNSYTNVSNLGYLSSEQALADYAVLIGYLKSTVIPNAANAPVIAFGGSYGGMLAAWFRIKYPHVVVGYDCYLFSLRLVPS
uniref:Lysosomal Pro-X carboxypeptidase n=1 Tax=Plectus sambesii TaxID=2011161 RepID=A0A914UMN4_9BILA